MRGRSGNPLAVLIVMACADPAAIPPGLSTRPSLVELGVTRAGSAVAARFELVSTVLLHPLPPNIPEGLIETVRLDGLPAALRPNAPHPVDLLFVPRSPGVFRGSIELTTIEGPSAVVELIGSATGPWAELGSGDFGRRPLATSTISISIRNLTEERLRIERAVVQPEDAPFRVRSAGATLAPKASGAIVVDFTPLEPGRSFGVLEVVLSIGTNTDLVAVQLTGDAFQDVFAASPSRVDLGRAFVGATRSRRVRLKNFGSVPELLVVSSTPPFFASVTATVVAPRSEEDLEIVFRPVVAGTYESEVSVGRVAIQVSGVAEGPPTPRLVVPTEVSFGIVGPAGAEESLFVENRGRLDAKLDHVEVDGPFALTAPLPKTIAAGDVHRVTLRTEPFEPPSTSPAFGALVISSGGQTVRARLVAPRSDEPVNRSVHEPRSLELGSHLGADLRFRLRVDGYATVSLAPGTDPRITLEPIGTLPVHSYWLTVYRLEEEAPAVTGIVEIRWTGPSEVVRFVPVEARRTASPLAFPELLATASFDPASSEVELHLVREGYALFDAPYDACPCNPSPDWGVPGSDLDDPQLLTEYDLASTRLELRKTPVGRARLFVVNRGPVAATIDAKVTLRGADILRTVRRLAGNQALPIGTLALVGTNPSFERSEDAPSRLAATRSLGPVCY
ncbi:MAG: choice-of-anchor D domain-containing protein [Deltaproteobacteria bacterium]|nr:choice-of-anchor D domain-containing protein [Deltaproteobacteria bacterium]